MTKKIIIAGISQGGTLALHIGLTYLFELGGIIGIHTLFLKNIPHNCSTGSSLS